MVTRTKNGQALVESCLVMAVIVTLLIAMVPVLGLITARLWVNFALYERLRCELRQSSSLQRNACEREFRGKIDPIWWGRLSQSSVQLQTSRSQRVAEAHAIWCNSKESNICQPSQLLRFEIKIREDRIKDLAN